MSNNIHKTICQTSKGVLVAQYLGLVHHFFSCMHAMSACNSNAQQVCRQVSTLHVITCVHVRVKQDGPFCMTKVDGDVLECATCAVR